MGDKMNADYKVGDLIYDANIYDGLNTFLSDLQFYKKWLPENKDDRRILELCCGTGRLTLPIARMDTIFVGLITLHPCLNRQRQKLLKQD